MGMTSEIGGMQVHGASQVVHVLSTGTELSGTILTWAAISASDHGPTGIVENTTTGRITLVPGLYRVDVELSIENVVVSGLSSEDITVQDILTFYLAKGASPFPTEINGTRSRVANFEGLSANPRITAFVEITKSDLDNGFNYISLWAKTDIAGGTASDFLVSNARFLVNRLD